MRYRFKKTRTLAEICEWQVDALFDYQVRALLLVAGYLFRTFFLEKKVPKKPLENDYGRFPEQLCGTFVLLWLQFSTRGNSWISCKAGLMSELMESRYFL
jgi:hypothetical protein